MELQSIPSGYANRIYDLEALRATRGAGPGHDLYVIAERNRDQAATLPPSGASHDVYPLSVTQVRKKRARAQKMQIGCGQGRLCARYWEGCGRCPRVG